MLNSELSNIKLLYQEQVVCILVHDNYKIENNNSLRFWLQYQPGMKLLYISLVDLQVLIHFSSFNYFKATAQRHVLQLLYRYYFNTTSTTDL